MTAASRERAALVNTMRAVGPDGPTLCGDWTTRDLAAHLVLRERRLDAAPGILIPALAGYTARKQQHLADSTDSGRSCSTWWRRVRRCTRRSSCSIRW